MFGPTFNPILLIFGFVAFIIAVTIHEFAHAWVAEHLGDPTPRLMGRLSLNPIHHIDIFGTILLPLFLIISNVGFVFGWAKPVQFDPFNLRNPRRDTAMISLAGAVSNLLLAIGCSVILRLPMSFFLSAILQYFLTINVILGIFNLVPIHPLDGFKVVEGMLPEQQAHEWHELERYGMIFLVFLMFPIFGGTAPIQRIISPVIDFVLRVLLPGAPIL